jgi:adenosine deaminase
MRDFELQMRMIDYLHRQYPRVHISLHAGELAPGLVPPEGLLNHIRDSIVLGHAERIGHGVDVMYEPNPLQLLKQMADDQVLVEVCLTSNDIILGIRGRQHPLPIYLKYGVPVALATDDAGVARGDLSAEYQRAVEGYDLHYAEVKSMVRQSLEHSFLPGKSLWADTKAWQIVSACSTQSSACEEFLAANERARMQWELEKQLAAFEARF